MGDLVVSGRSMMSRCVNVLSIEMVSKSSADGRLVCAKSPKPGTSTRIIFVTNDEPSRLELRGWTKSETR